MTPGDAFAELEERLRAEAELAAPEEAPSPQILNIEHIFTHMHKGDASWLR
jgi:hypothetical protein